MAKPRAIVDRSISPDDNRFLSKADFIKKRNAEKERKARHAALDEDIDNKEKEAKAEKKAKKAAEKAAKDKSKGKK